MGKMLYRIGSISQSSYYLKVEKEKFLGSNEILTEQFHVPLLDFLNSFRGKKILDLFLESILQNYDLQKIKKDEKVLSSFTFLFFYSINQRSNKKKDLKHVIPNYDLKQRNDRRNLIKDISQYYEECCINYSISNQSILQSTTKEYIKEKEKEIYSFIIDDCEILINEMVNQFDGTIFHNDCIQKSKKKLIENQSLEIKKKEIPKSQIPIINNILKKNPELNKPNIINLSGEHLIKYLLSYYRLKQESEWEIFYVQKENVFYPHDSDGFYYTLQLESHILTNNNKCYLKIKSCHNYFHSYNYYVLDINVPFVKQVNVNRKSISDVPEICFELKNFEDEKSLNEDIEYVPIINEDRIPCLIDTELFYKYMIDNKLFYRKEEILNEINEKIDVLKDLTENVLQQAYINDIINSEYSESNFKKDSNKIIEVNNRLLKNFHFTKTQSYFFHQLFHQYQKDIILISESHQFVIPNTKEQENVELGRRTEWVVDRFLKNYIEFEKWYYTIDEEDPKKRVTEYPKYPFNSIPVSKTIWNNLSGESFKPYDFQINFRNVEYKIEVKSTRGDEENVFYISVKELEELVKDPDIYFILRLSYIQKYEMYFGIQFNDEFYGRFYKIKPETIKLVKKKLPEWKEYYKTDTIRFTVDQFELIPDLYEGDSEPKVYPEPNIFNSKYWEEFDEFVQNRYFNQLEGIIDTYSVFPEVSKLKEEVSILKLGKKFHFVENLIVEEDITIEDVDLLFEEESESTNDDDLPF